MGGPSEKLAILKKLYQKYMKQAGPGAGNNGGAGPQGMGPQDGSMSDFPPPPPPFGSDDSMSFPFDFPAGGNNGGAGPGGMGPGSGGPSKRKALMKKLHQKKAMQKKHSAKRHH